MLPERQLAAVFASVLLSTVVLLACNGPSKESGGPTPGKGDAETVESMGETSTALGLNMGLSGRPWPGTTRSRLPTRFPKDWN